jgi:hypothetical protein
VPPLLGLGKLDPPTTLSKRTLDQTTTPRQMNKAKSTIRYEQITTTNSPRIHATILKIT